MLDSVLIQAISRRQALGKAIAVGIAVPAFASLARALEVSVTDPGSDATPRLQAAHDQCAMAGGGTIRINQPLVCRTARAVGQGTTASLVIWGDNITLEFGPEGSIEFLPTGPNYRPVIVGGVGKVMQRGASLYASRCIDNETRAPTYQLAKGADEILLPEGITAQPHDILFVRTGELLSSTTWEPDSELVQVAAVNGRVAKLTKPLAKSYANEPLGSCHLRSRLKFGESYPFGVTNVSARISRNIAFVNPRLRALSCLQLLSIWSVAGFSSTGGALEYNNLGVGSRDSRDVVWNTALRHNGAVNGTSYAIAPSTGCTDWDVTWDVVSQGSNYLHIHEGVARSTFKGSLTMNGNDCQSAGLSIAARAYDLHISANIDTGMSDMAGLAVGGEHIENIVFGKMVIRNNSHRGAAIRIDDGTDVTFSTPPILTGSNRIVKMHVPSPVAC